MRERKRGGTMGRMVVVVVVVVVVLVVLVVVVVYGFTNEESKPTSSAG